MTKLIIIVAIVGAIAFALSLIKPERGGQERKKPLYKYTRKNFFMTKSESAFFKVLQNKFGDKYFIFPQVHLSSILDHKVSGQNWKPALSHINQKSVDFVLCDKEYISPKFAIELDDITHEREDRKERDSEVEKIFREAGLSLIRIKSSQNIEEIDFDSILK